MADIVQSALAVQDATQRQYLHKLLSEYLIQVTDQMFRDKDIFVDGYRFINCSFVGCRLHALRGTFEFHHCFLIGVTKLFGEDAMKSIQLYTLGRPTLSWNPAFAARSNDDGTFSIGKGASIE